MIQSAATMELTNFDVMANKDIVAYYNWLDKINKKQNEYKYSICAAVDPYSPFDLIQIKNDADGNSTLSYIELKGRNVDINQYDDCIVEEYKIKNLQSLGASTSTPIYIVALYYPSSKLAIWRIDDSTPYYIEKIKCKWHTAKNDDKIEKDMVKLPLSEAKIYNFTYNTDIQSDN